MIHQLIDLWFRGWRSLVEILLLSAAIYYGYLYFRGTRGAKVLTGLAIVFLTLTLISTLLNLVVIGWIVRSFSVFLAVALVVIFQPELRRGLAALGGHPIFSLTSEKRETVHDLAEAVMQLANKQFGALIAIENVIDDARRENAFGLLMSLNMLIEFGDAADYTHADFRAWCGQVGFRRFDLIPLAGPSAAAVAYK